MFSGFIKSCGKIIAIEKRSENAILIISAENEELVFSVGDSISVDGACLTVARAEKKLFYADASHETLAKTTLGSLSAGNRVNLEAPLKVSDSFHGHIVLGHVDGVGEITSLERKGTAVDFEIKCPPDLMPYLADKGSVTIDGVSLTVNSSEKENSIRVTVIPHTLSKTTLGEKQLGDKVNIEVDVIARYLERLLKNRDGANTDKSKITEEMLRENGFI